MVATLLSAAITCFAALFLGQAALRLSGAERWSWLAPPVGLAVAMLVAAPSLHLPGRCVTGAILLGALTIAAAVWCLRSVPHRPPLAEMAAALPVALLVLVPFIAAGRDGIPGVTVNNDMAAHLLFVESFLSETVAAVSPLPQEYPLGPHAVAALLTQGTGVDPVHAFAGFSTALPLINAWTTLAVARNASWFGRTVLATVAGMPFLVAAYYGQGAYKEVAVASMALALALYLSCGPRLGRGRWVPYALLVGGIVSAYSLAGLPWPLAIAGAWVVGLLAITVWRRQLSEVPGALRRELPALAIGAAVLALVLLPQADRIYDFVALRGGIGTPVDDIGNLVGPLPVWEVLGVWNNPDFRLPATAAYSGGYWSLFVLALVLFGAFWAFRRGRWLLPLVAIAMMGIWALSDQTQSPYVAAKALVIASPLLLLMATLPLVDPGPERRPRWAWLLVPLLGLVLFLRIGKDDLRTLRWSPVGPTAHADQLRSFRLLVAGRPTLFLGSDEFVNWQLAGAPVRAASLVTMPQVPMRAGKDWDYEEPMDLDLLRAKTLNAYEWIVTPRDVASSAPPPQLRLVRDTEDYQLWKRVGEVRERSILAEGEWPGAVLDCGTPTGRAILAAGGVAAVRARPVTAPLPLAGPGETVTARLVLSAGSWELLSPYTSYLPVKVTAPGLNATLPANLDRGGPRYPIGRVTVPRRETVPVSFEVEDTLLAPATAVANLKSVIAGPLGSTRIVPIARACGRYVDWYRPAPS